MTRDFHLHYGPVHALKGVSLTVEAGEIVHGKLAHRETGKFPGGPLVKK